MYFTQDKITEIFILADEFCKEFEKTMSNYTNFGFHPQTIHP